MPREAVAGGGLEWGGHTGVGLGTSRAPTGEPLGQPSAVPGSHRGHEGGARRRGKPPDSRRFPGPGEFPAGLRLGGRSEILGREEKP